jgi:hypothetical protein
MAYEVRVNKVTVKVMISDICTVVVESPNLILHLWNCFIFSKYIIIFYQ